MTLHEAATERETRAHPTFRQAFLYWLKLGFVNFGGPTGQISIMYRDLVERKRWISGERFLHALNYCNLLPGPEAMQLAIYVGWLLHRTAGGIVAGVFFVMPSIAVLLGLGYVYVTFGTIPLVAGLFVGLKAVVMGVVAYAVIKIGRRALKAPLLWGIAAAAFVALFFAHVPFPFVILGAALVGLAGHRFAPALFAKAPEHGPPTRGAVLGTHDAPPAHATPNGRRALILLGIGAALLLAPLAALLVAFGPDDVRFQDGLFFAKASFVTFGGAYAVLSYIAQQSVQSYHWLGATQMVDGLGLAETTPGPLIMVVCFVGFMAGWNLLHTLGGAVFGGLIATYFTFLPSFVFVLVGGPYIEKLRSNRRLTSALTAVTAAVVGIVVNLAVYLALNVLYADGAVQWFPLALASASFLVLLVWEVDIIPVVLVGALLGLAYKLIGG